MRERTRWFVALVLASVLCFAAGWASTNKPYPRFHMTSWQKIYWGPVTEADKTPAAGGVIEVGILHDYLTGAEVAVIPGVGMCVIGVDKGPEGEPTDGNY